MSEIKNECEDCGEESWDNHVWDQCPTCKSNNTSYRVYADDDHG